VRTGAGGKALGWFLELRPIPVLLWSYTAVALGTGLAVAEGTALDTGWLAVALALAVLIQGWETHAINEIYDWRSGTDAHGSPRALSGGSKVVRGGGKDDRVAVVAAGITVHEALKAADTLAEEGISVRVIDAYSVKPIDAATLRRAAAETGGRLITVEDHWPEGGLGAAVLDVFADEELRPRVVKLAVRDMPGSGKPDELLAAAGIDAAHIADAARRLARVGPQIGSLERRA